MKKLLVVTISMFSMFFVALMVVAQPAAAVEPVKIGVLVPLTGIVAQGGLEMKYGIEMAAEEKGKVLGRPTRTAGGRYPDEAAHCGDQG